jgi:hypothetical protein
MQELFNQALDYVKNIPATRIPSLIQLKKDSLKYLTRTNCNFTDCSSRLQRVRIKQKLRVG